MSTDPDVLRRYFDRQDDRDDPDALIALFSDDAVVVDEGRTRHGIDEIRAWRSEVATKYTYTTEIRAIDEREPGRYVVDGRITGDFPGGVADLRWELTVAGDRIRRLVIAP